MVRKKGKWILEKASPGDPQQKYKLYSLALKEAKDIIWDWDFATGELTLNETLIEGMGGSPIKTSINWWYDNLHPDEKEKVVANIKQAIASSREHWTDRYRFRAEDGSYLWIQDNAFILRNRDGTVNRMIGVMRDVSEQIQNDERLRQSEIQFKLLANTMPQLVWKANHQGMVTWLNERWLNFTGAHQEDLRGNGWLNWIDPEVAAQVSLDWKKAVERGTLFEAEFKLKSKSGLMNWFLTRAIPVRDETGHIVRWFGTSTDINENKLNAQLTKRSEEQARLALRTAKLGFWEYDIANKITDGDRQWRRSWGFDELAPVHIDDFESKIHRDDLPKVQEIFFRSIQNAADFEIEFRIFPQPGMMKWVQTKGSSELNEKGLVQRMFGTTLDITETKQFEKDLRVAKESAEEANQAKSEFLANMSHEIRTPLAAIVGFVELLQSSSLSAQETNEFLNRISRNAIQLTHLIDEILDLSKIEANRLEIEKMPVDLRSLLEDAFSASAFKAHEKGLCFEVNWAGDLPHRILTDPTRFKQILINLAGNAVKFTDQGTVSVIPSLRQLDGEEWLDVEVRDTGIGLTQQQQRRIFEPFMQADGSINRKFGGTGLGLALSRRLARVLGGDIVLRGSELHQGSSFVFSIPCERAPQLIKVEPREGGTLTESRMQERPLEGCHILIVDDAPDNQVLVSRYIGKAGATFETAENGSVAVQKATDGQFDLILMDVQMPVMDGIQALKALKGARYPKPIVALTAHALKSERERCLQMGFDEYLTKPIDRAHLISSIDRLIQQSRAAS